MHYGYPKIWVLGGFRGENLKFYFSRPQKALTTLRRNTSFDVFRVKIGPAVRAVPEFRNRKKKQIKKYHGGCTFHVYAGKKPIKPISAKIGPFQLAPDVITRSKFDP